MKRIIITVIICLAIAILGIQTGNAAPEPVKPCIGDPMLIDFGDIIDCGVNISDTRNFDFYSSNGDKVRLTMKDMTFGNPRPYLYLYDPNGRRIGYFSPQDTGSFQDYNLNLTGKYTIVVFEYGNDEKVDFRIALQGIIPSPPGARILNLDSLLDGNIDPVTDSDVFIFDGTAGDKVRLTMNDMTSGNPRPYLYLYDPNGTRIGYFSPQDTGSFQDYNLNLTGEYVVVVFEYGNDEKVDFRIALQGIIPSPLGARILNLDSLLDGNIDPVTDSDVFIFDGTAGDKVRLTMNDMTSGNPRPYLYLYDPNGRRIGYFSPQDTGSFQDYNLNLTGEYVVVVFEYGNDEKVDFRIALQGIIPSPVNSPTLCHNIQIDDGIDPVTDSDVFIFDGTAGDRVRLTMNDMTSGNPRPYLYLYDPNGRRIGYFSPQDTGSFQDYNLNLTGEYVVVVFEYGNDEKVDYRIGFTCILGDCFGNCPPDPVTFSYTPVTPCRIVDTRYTSAGIIDAFEQRNFHVYGSGATISAQGGNAGGCSSPLGQPLAAHINVVAVNPTGKGNLQAFPVGAGPGAGLSVNYNTIDTNLANAGTVETVTGTGPDITVTSRYSSAHTAIDVLGYYYSNGDLLYKAVSPCRIVDTRYTSAGIIDAFEQRNFHVYGSGATISAQGGNAGGCSSPLGQPLAAHINVVAVNPTGKGNLQAFPVGAGPGAGLSVNYNTIDTNLANAGTVETVTGTGPDITVTSRYSSAHTAIDVLGYYYSNGDLLYKAVSPCRIVDTRYTSAGIIDAFEQRNFHVYGSGATISAQGGNAGGCSSPLGQPLAAHINVVAVNPTGKGNLQAFPVGAGPGAGLSVNYNTIDTNLANAGTVETVTGTGPDITVTSRYSSAHTAIDVLGYYYSAP